LSVKIFAKKYIWDKIFLSTFDRAGHKIIKITVFDMLASPTKVFNPCLIYIITPTLHKNYKICAKGRQWPFFLTIKTKHRKNRRKPAFLIVTKFNKTLKIPEISTTGRLL